MNDTATADTAEGYVDPDALSVAAVPLGPITDQLDPTQAAAASLDAGFLPTPRIFLGVDLWPYSNAVRQLIAQLSEPTDANSFFQMIALRVVYDVGRHYAAATAQTQDPRTPALTHEAARRVAFRLVLLDAAQRADYRVGVLLWLEELSDEQIKEGRRQINEIFAAAQKTELESLDTEGGGGNG